jgi:regulator of sirC expression with transglutaminase-like and TPR domain
MKDLVEALGSPETSPERAALLVARDAHPSLDIEAHLAWLERNAAPLATAVRRLDSPERQAEELGRHVYGTLGFTGNEDDYYDPRNSYLDDVIRRRTGIPLSLAMVLMAIGRRAGAQVDGIAFPGHFLARIGGEAGVYVDPFRKGRILGEADLEALARHAVGTPLERRMLRPADTSAMIVRMLTNLKGAHRRRGDHAAALLVCDRLFDLVGHPEHRRDRGLHALALRSYATALEDLRAYLAARPDARDSGAVRKAIEQALEGQGTDLQ